MLTVSRTKNGRRKFITGQSVNLLSASHSHFSASYLPNIKQSVISMFREACSRFSDLPFMRFRNGLATKLPEKQKEELQQSPPQDDNISISSFNSLSYSKVEKMVNHITAALRYLGIKKGDTIGLMAMNSPLWLISDLAILARGAITVPIPTSIDHEKLAYTILHSGMRLIITQNQYVARILGVSHRCDNLRLVVSLDTTPDSSNLLNSASLVFGILEQNFLTNSVIDKILFQELFLSNKGSSPISSLSNRIQGIQPEDLLCFPHHSGDLIEKSEDIGHLAHSIDGISYLNEIRDSKVSTQAHLKDRLGSYYMRDGRIFTCFATESSNQCLVPFPPLINQASTKHDRRFLEQAVDKKLLDISSYLRTHVSVVDSLEGYFSAGHSDLSGSFLSMSFGAVDNLNSADLSLTKRSSISSGYLLEEEDPLNIITLDDLMQKTKYIPYAAADDVHTTSDDLCSIFYKTRKKCNDNSPSIIGLGVTYNALISAMASLAIGYLPGYMRSPGKPYTQPYAEFLELSDSDPIVDEHPLPFDRKSKKIVQKQISQEMMKADHNFQSPRGEMFDAFISRGTGVNACTSGVTLHGSANSVSKAIGHTIQQPSFLSHLPLFLPFERVLEHVAYIRGYQIYYSSGVDKKLLIDLQDSQCTLFVGTAQIYQRLYKTTLSCLADISPKEINLVEKELDKRGEKLDNLCQEAMFLDHVGVDQLTAGPFGPLTVNLNIGLTMTDYMVPLSSTDDPQSLAIQKIFIHSFKTLLAASRVVPENVSKNDCNRILDTFTLFKDSALQPYCKISRSQLAKHYHLVSAFLAPIVKANGSLSHTLMISLKTIFYQSRFSTLKVSSRLKFINKKIFGGNTTHFLSIGGPLSNEVCNFFRIGTGGIFSSIYGVSEFLGLGCYTYYHDLTSLEGLLGRSMPGISCVVMDCKDRCGLSLEKSGVGELCLKGKTASIGIYKGSSLFKTITQTFGCYCNSFNISNLGAIKILKKRLSHMLLHKNQQASERLDNLVMLLLNTINPDTFLSDGSNADYNRIQFSHHSSSVCSIEQANRTPTENIIDEVDEATRYNPLRPNLSGSPSTHPSNLLENHSPTEFGIASIANKQASMSMSHLSSISKEDLRFSVPLVSPTASSARHSLTISELKMSRIWTSSSARESMNFKSSSHASFISEANSNINNNHSNNTASLPTIQPCADFESLFTDVLEDACSPDFVIVDNSSDSEGASTKTTKPNGDTTRASPLAQKLFEDTDDESKHTFLNNYSRAFTSRPLFQGSFADQQQKRQEQFSEDGLFDADGYLHTGDLVKILPDGRLVYLRSLYKQLRFKNCVIDRELADRIIERIPYIITCCLFANPEAAYTVAIVNCRSNLLTIRYKAHRYMNKNAEFQNRDFNNDDNNDNANILWPEEAQSEEDAAIVEQGISSFVQSITSTISGKLSSDDGLLCERYGKDENDLMWTFLPTVAPLALNEQTAQIVERLVIADIAAALQEGGMTSNCVPRRIKIYIDREMCLNRVLYTHSGRKNYRQFEHVFKADIRDLYKIQKLV